jgi:NADH-quinone oxidoreductase subunit N
MPAPSSIWLSLAPALPEIFLATAVCVLLLVDVFAGARRPWLAPTLTLAILAVGAALTLQSGATLGRVVAFDGLYVTDPLALFLKLAGFLFVAVALLYSRPALERRGIHKGEYYFLALTALLGIFVVVSANSLLTVYIGIELLSLSLYAMVAFDRESGLAAESAMKYFVLGAIASGAMLYGMSMVYGLSGTLQLDELAARLAGEPSLGLVLGVVFLVVAVAFKFGAAPFHMWVPDVYHGAPTPVALFVATAPKIASFALAFRLLAQGLPGLSETWTEMLAAVAVLSLIVGNLLAIAQTNLKRMLAYSAIANVGFILLAFVPGTTRGHEAALYYTIVYVIMALGSFGVVLLASRANFEADQLDDYRGLHARDPLLALLMLMLMFSTAGVPPFVGFWAKLAVFQALWEAGHLWLVVTGALASVVGAFYYLRVVKLMYFDDPGDLPQGGGAASLRFVLGVNAFAVLVLGLLPGTLLDLCGRVLGAAP